MKTKVPLFFFPIESITVAGTVIDECTMHVLTSEEQRTYLVKAANAHAALLELRAKYNRLHDALDDCMTAKRLTEDMLPDDFKALADMMADCVAADAAVTEILEGE